MFKYIHMLGLNPAVNFYKCLKRVVCHTRNWVLGHHHPIPRVYHTMRHKLWRMVEISVMVVSIRRVTSTLQPSPDARLYTEGWRTIYTQDAELNKARTFQSIHWHTEYNCLFSWLSVGTLRRGSGQIVTDMSKKLLSICVGSISFKRVSFWPFLVCVCDCQSVQNQSDTQYVLRWLEDNIYGCRRESSTAVMMTIVTNWVLKREQRISINWTTMQCMRDDMDWFTVACCAAPRRVRHLCTVL